MFQHIPRLLKLAGPLILSSSAVTMMQLIDAFVLSHHSSEAVAAIGPSSLAVILFQGFLFGTAGYAGTFVAHNHGRADEPGVRKSAWLGIHASLIAGLLALLFAWPLGQLFFFTGHQAQVATDEAHYFTICMAGSLFPVLSSALAGWLSGIGRTVTVTWVTFISFAVNALLAWALVLGTWGCPRLGITGAALATVLAQLLAALLYLLIFARSGGLTDTKARRFDHAEFRRFLALAAPLGLRISGELVAWTLFLIIIGRLGTVELAASSIAFRINGMAFFPALGLGQAAGILVGQARGAGRDADVPAIGWQSLAVCEIWMVGMAGGFVFAAEPLVAIFAGSGADAPHIIATGALLMKFVALYCLVDAANIVIGCVLAAAGDTRWLARAFISASAVFLGLLWLIDRLSPSLVTEWILATTFVGVTALVWTLRFHAGGWRAVRVLNEKAEAAD